MTEEYGYVVDEDDNVLYKTTREEVKRKALLHRGVIIFVFNSEGKLFVQKRSRNKKTYLNLWGIGAGGG